MKTINSFRSKLLALTLALMASVSTFAYEFEYVNDFHINGFAYKVLPSNTLFPYGSAALIEIADCNKDVVIPEFVSYGNTEYRIITFGMGSVVFTNDASSVVESITIPKTTNIINKNVLAGCPNLKTVVVDSENPYYDSRENCNAIITTSQNPYFTPNTLIAGCKTTIIPNSVAEIGDNAFYNCESLDIITIPRSVSKIGNSAFNACSSLSSIILSENLTAIGDWAFDNCNNLKEVICYALQPPTISKYTFPGFAPWVYVPTESIERYKAASEWKKLLICDISWFEACNEYKHVKLSVISYGNKLIYSLVTDDGSEIPDVDSVWILNTDKEPLQKFYGQSRDTIDLLFLELGTYILEVYLNECVKRKIFFVHHPKMKYIWCDTWNVLELKYRYSSYTTKEDFETWRYYLAQDTIINNYTYTAVTRQTTKVPEGVYPFTIPEPEYVAAVRFTDDRKVYIYYDNTEYLLYDFNVQPGDELTVFAGINHYHSHHTNTIRVDEVFGTEISLSVFPDFYGDVRPTCFGVTKWVEGVGDLCGFITGADCGLSEYQTALLCAYKDGNTEYTTEYEEYAEYGCEYNSGENKEYILTLPGLQRTVCNEYCGDTEDDNSANFTYKQTFDSIFFENDKPYILCNGYLLREEDNKIFLYSQSLNKDIVLYDFTLEVGDSLPAYIKDFDGTMSSDDTLVVTDISSVTLLDGKEYKKWTFDNGMEYVEGIGMYGGHRNGNFFGLIQEIVVPCHTGTHLVCVSKNGKLLYQMDEAEMERLGAECLCDYDRGPRKDNAKDGQIGGRPTPTQWNQLEVVLRQMDNNHTILQAETFSYTLEDISQQVNNKTYFQLARQSTKDTATTKSVVGALHFGKDEDNRVYFLRDGLEYVLYDFTAEIGDTVEIFAGINNYPQETTYTHVVVDKDTTEDGACRMFLEVVFPDETNTTAENAEKVWLAGLGSVDGIVHNAAKRTSNAHAAPSRSARSSETESSVMLCAWREDSCLYTTNHPDYDTFGCVYNQDLTAVESPTSSSSYQKVLRGGQLLIMHNGKTYTVMGVEIK